MVGFTAAAGAGDFGFPVGGFLVESAEGFSALRDGGPGFVSARNIGHEAAGGKRDLTALRGLSLGHPETAHLLCRCRRLGERLGLSCCREAPQADEHEDHEWIAVHAAHPSTEVFGPVNHVSTAGC